MNIILPHGTVWPPMLQGSEEWFNARKGRATASCFKKILTPTGKLSAQADEYARKLARECKLADPHEFIGNKHTEWGNEYEPIARDIFCATTGRNVVEVGFVQNNSVPVLGCSPDGLIIGDDGITAVAGLEIKCPSIDTLVGWMIDGVLPTEHLPQVHGSMIVTGLQEWEFVAYFPGVPLFRQRATWNAYTDKLESALHEFVPRYAVIREQVLELLGREAV